MNVKKFKALLIEQGYTLGSFSVKSNIPLSNISRMIRTGDTKVSTLVKICKVLEVEANVLLNSK